MRCATKRPKPRRAVVTEPDLAKRHAAFAIEAGNRPATLDTLSPGALFAVHWSDRSVVVRLVERDTLTTTIGFGYADDSPARVNNFQLAEWGGRITALGQAR